MKKKKNGETGKNRPVSEEEIVQKLVTQIDKYECYLAGLDDGKADNQAVFAYTNLLKTIIGFSRKQETGGKISAAAIKEEAEKILEAEYGIKR